MSFYLQFLIFSRACFQHENSFKSEKQDHFHSISSKSCKSKSGLIFPIWGHFHAAKGLWTLDKVVTFWQRKFVVQLSWQIFVLKMSWQMRTLLVIKSPSIVCKWWTIYYNATCKVQRPMMDRCFHQYVTQISFKIYGFHIEKNSWADLRQSWSWGYEVTPP